MASVGRTSKANNPFWTFPTKAKSIIANDNCKVCNFIKLKLGKTLIGTLVKPHQRVCKPCNRQRITCKQEIARYSQKWHGFLICRIKDKSLDAD